MRGKKFDPLELDRLARCVAPRLRACWANLSGPKTSDLIGA